MLQNINEIKVKLVRIFIDDYFKNNNKIDNIEEESFKV